MGLRCDFATFMEMKAPRNIFQFKKWLTANLEDLYDQLEAASISRLLVEHISLKPSFMLSLDKGAEFSIGEFEKAVRCSDRLLQGEPIQYVLGEAHFYGRMYEVEPAVLIPRGETEELCAWILHSFEAPSETIKILDIGTGSGCIAITLALEAKEMGFDTKIQALDIGEKALNVAQTNAHKLGANISFHLLDIFHASDSHFSQLDYIVSNPPYIPQKEISQLAINVRDFEPKTALQVPDDDPLIFYKQIAYLAKNWLKKGGRLYVETHEDHNASLAEYLTNQGCQEVEPKQDLNKKWRMLRAVL